VQHGMLAHEQMDGILVLVGVAHYFPQLGLLFETQLAV